MMILKNERLKTLSLSITIFLVFIFAWEMYANSLAGPAIEMDPEYAAVMQSLIHI